MLGLDRRLKTTPERSRLMARVRQSGTSPERAVLRLVRSCGLRCAVKAQELPGTPDIVNHDSQWAIFVHGCFWHAHQGCSLWTIPRNNRAFWRKKFRDNRERDEGNLKELRKLGYSALVVWACELKREASLRRRIFRFAGRVGNSLKKNSNSADLSIQRMQCRSSVSPGESYRLGASRKYVTRTVRLSSRRALTSRLYLGKSFPPGIDPSSAYDQAFLRRAEPQWSNRGLPAIRGVDLFSGCGGLSLGTREACLAIGYRFETLLAVDKDPSSLHVYKINFNPQRAYHCDIRDIVDGSLRSRLTPSEKQLLKGLAIIDILLAGPPCQGYSDLNNHTRRNDRRNELYERVGRFAEIAEPKHILIENVPTVLHGHDRAFDTTADLLLALGYRVDAGVVDLSELGVPQRRRRHVLIASLTKPVSVKDVMEKYRLAQTRSAAWAIKDLEDEGGSSVFTRSFRHNWENLRRIRYLMTHDLYDLPNRMRPPCHQNGNHSYKSMYGRLKYDEPAQTITSGFGSPGQGRFIHPSQPRTLTPHEAARLQFFPDFFDFSCVKTRTALANMIGNAVPMKLSYAFSLEFLI